MVTLFELCRFDLNSCTSYLKFQPPASWTQPSIFAAFLALLHPVQISFDPWYQDHITIFTRASTFFHLCNMRPVEAWIFVTTDCLSSLQLPRKGCFHIQAYWRVIWTVDTIFLPSSQCFLRVPPWGVSFLFFSLAILILQSLQGLYPVMFQLSL